MANKQQPKNNNLPKFPRFNIFWIYGVIAVFIIGWSLLGSENDKPLKGDWAMVEPLVEQGEVERIRVVNRETAEVFLKKEAAEQYRNDKTSELQKLPATGAHIYYTIPSVDSFREDLKTAESELPAEERVTVVYENDNKSWIDIVGSILPWVLIIGFWFFYAILISVRALVVGFDYQGEMAARRADIFVVCDS